MLGAKKKGILARFSNELAHMPCHFGMRAAVAPQVSRLEALAKLSRVLEVASAATAVCVRLRDCGMAHPPLRFVWVVECGRNCGNS